MDLELRLMSRSRDGEFLPQPCQPNAAAKVEREVEISPLYSNDSEFHVAGIGFGIQAALLAGTLKGPIRVT